MANLILRPSADGQYHGWQGISFGVVHVTAFDLIDEADANGDDQYVWTSDPASFTVGLGSAAGGNWPVAFRTSSIRVVATVRTTGTTASFRFRIRSLGTDYDSDVLTTTSAVYTEIGLTYDQCPTAWDWDLATINRMEVGLDLISTDGEFRCTKLEVFIHEEPVPTIVMVPDGNGATQNWAAQPSTSPAYMTVSGAFDGDLSYVHDTTVNHVSLFTNPSLAATLTPPNIDRVAIKALVKNRGTVADYAATMLRSNATNYRGGSETLGILIPPDDEWHLIRDDYLNDPNVGWPSGLAAATAWTDLEVNAIQVGVENSGGGDFRCTSISTEVWLTPTPADTIDCFPTVDGFHQDWSAVVPGPNAWAAVNEDPPDDIASYVTLDADATGTSAFASFTVAGGAIAVGERVHNVEARYRIRLANLPHSEALVAPVVRISGETYVGRPQKIEGTGGLWFDVRWDFHRNPDTGDPWVDEADVKAAEWGFVALEGAVLLSRQRVQIQTIYDYRGTPAATDIQLTDAATVTYLPRSLVDGTIFAVTQFSVGTDGYDPTAPYLISAVATADTTLAAEIYRANISWLEYDGLSTPWTVDYWCRVPREVAKGGIGEMGLWAEILWSPIPAEIGTYFLYALVHHPCQTRHDNTASFYLIRIEY